jgi:hypothetical protein
MLTKLSYDSTSLSLTDSWCYSAIGSACVQAGTFGGSVGLPCMCAKVRGWPPCQRKAIRKQPNAL